MIKLVRATWKGIESRWSALPLKEKIVIVLGFPLIFPALMFLIWQLLKFEGNPEYSKCKDRQ